MKQEKRRENLFFFAFDPFSLWYVIVFVLVCQTLRPYPHIPPLFSQRNFRCEKKNDYGFEEAGTCLNISVERQSTLRLAALLRHIAFCVRVCACVLICSCGPFSLPPFAATVRRLRLHCGVYRIVFFLTFFFLNLFSFECR